ADKILKGGNGNWGKNVMAAHPQHTREEATEMVRYILSLSDQQNIALPLRGNLTTAEHVSTRTTGSYVIRASYTDQGNPVTGTLTGSSLLVLRHPKVQAEDYELHRNVDRRHVDGTDFSYVGNAREGSYIGFRNVDLTAIQRIRFRAVAPTTGSRIEIRTDAPDGPLVGTAEIPQAGTTNPEAAMQVATAPVTTPDGPHDLYFVFRNPGNAANDILNLDWVYFDNGKQPAPKP
ncbi:MAG: carbohydrate-binding protein, partial [Ferruginibacter sp.]|nr:carbohydrate-binding protein [Cytophagales bacterium]